MTGAFAPSSNTPGGDTEMGKYVPHFDECSDSPTPGGCILENKSFWERHFVKPEWSVWGWIGWSLVTLITLGLFGGYIYAFCTLVIGYDKPFKGVCTNRQEMRDYICVLAVGQLAFGIFCIGQVCVGVVCLGQVTIGLLFTVGQISGSIIYAPIGQLVTGMAAEFGQLVFCVFRVRRAQLGFAFMRPFFGGNLLTTCGNSCNKNNN
eukprot:TRINITY_DN1086_c0_g1_i1.p1 TRINITY_DN1086_c0_g1~~TRINITY_DN1086_c0_g1_i1.p1  ORF type:complete len:206 (-),score=21.10 TRINITY_DN1086_c0_g1_i1:152-769(-)